MKAWINTGMLADMSLGVREATLGADTFDATHGIIVTWDNRTFAGGMCHINDYKVSVWRGRGNFEVLGILLLDQSRPMDGPTRLTGPEKVSIIKTQFL